MDNHKIAQKILKAVEESFKWDENNLRCSVTRNTTTDEYLHIDITINRKNSKILIYTSDFITNPILKEVQYINIIKKSMVVFNFIILKTKVKELFD